MTTKTRLSMMLAMFAAVATAEEPVACKTTLSISDVPPAMGAGVAAQPVYSPDGFRGWRIYNVQRSDQLTKQGIGSGALMTHVCGVPASEIVARDGNICCNVDASREVEITFQVNGQETKFALKR